MTLASVGQVVSQGAAQNGCAWMAAAIMMTLVQDDIPASRKPSLIAWDGVSPPPLNAPPPTPPATWHGRLLHQELHQPLSRPRAQGHTTTHSLKGDTPKPTLH